MLGRPTVVSIFRTIIEIIVLLLHQRLYVLYYKSSNFYVYHDMYTRLWKTEQLFTVTNTLIKLNSITKSKSTAYIIYNDTRMYIFMIFLILDAFSLMLLCCSADKFRRNFHFTQFSFRRKKHYKDFYFQSIFWKSVNLSKNHHLPTPCSFLLN